MLDNGYSYGVNTIKAVNTGDGLISIKSQLGDITHFTKLDHTNVCDGDGNAISGGLNDVINYLNELFTVGAFEAVVISDPYSTMVADVDGEDTTVSYIGYGLDPVGNDIYGSTSSNSQNGLLSTETIDQAGEYFTFDIRVEGTIGFGLVHTQASYDNGNYSGNAAYANPTRFGIDNSAHYGFQFSHWFHPTPNGSWTNYGANTAYSMRSGWSNFNGTDEQADWLAGNPIKVRVGIDTNSYITIDTLRDGTTWVPHARTSYPIVQGSEFRLGIKTNHTGARVFSLPKVHLLEPVAPTMYFRYIESPDGVYNYPLFATEEEANYYDLQEGGTGTSHTHTYADDPTNTTWYMPDTNSTMTATVVPTNAQTFMGNAINWSEVTSLTNADLTPPQFSSTDYTYQEGTAVNLQVTPQGASWSTSVSITPSGSGLVYDGYSLIQGTLADVTTDTIYTVNVTRANSYGSNVGSFEVEVTDVAPVQTNDTPWTKALDFSGGNEYAKQVSNQSITNPISMGFTGTTVPAHNSFANKTSNNTYSRPWATTIVFKIDGNNSTQHIWNYGEGAGNTDDNIYLKVDANQQLQFVWGRSGALNQLRVASGLQTNTWYGVYIAHKGARYSSSNATATNLANAFDVRLMSSGDSFSALGNNLSTSSNWISTGGTMDRAFGGNFTIGGRGANRNFHGKVASMVVTTLLTDTNMPSDAEVETMIIDPIKWLNDYKIGTSYRSPNLQYAQYIFTANGNNEGRATQVWLMGDGTSDSYANGMRNYVYPADQNYTKMQLNSMVSNDIETININGLT
jgi:hypothetical protein